MSPEPVTPYQQEQRARAETWMAAMLAREPTITSADKAYDWLRQHDYYVPREAVRYAWRETIRGAEHIDLVNRLEEQERVPRSWMEETSFRYGQAYNYIVEIAGRDSATGEVRKEYVTVTSQENLTLGEVFADAAQAAYDYGYMVWAPDYQPSISEIKYRL